MPSGGQINVGSGLQLQQASPGVTNTGNFNISGVGRSTGGSLGAIGPYLDTSGFQTPCIYGLYQTFRYPGTNALDSCAVGNGITLGSLASGDSFTAADQSILGNGISVGLRGSVVIGATAQCDPNSAFGGAGTGYHVLIGRATAMTSDVTNNRGLNVGIGANGSWVGGCIVGIGAGQNIAGKTGAGAKGGIYIGQYVASAAGTNQIILDTRSTGGAALADESRNNLIKIGDATHTIVEIGGRNHATVGGATQLAGDANSTFASTDAKILYPAITAPRVVNLMAANSVPAGYEVLVVDMAGTVGAVNTLTITRAGADTIMAGTTSVINAAYGFRRLITDGISKWTVTGSA